MCLQRGESEVAAHHTFLFYILEIGTYMVEKKSLKRCFFLLTIKKEKSVTVSHSDLFLASVLSVLLCLIKQEAYNQMVRSNQ